MLAPDFFEDGLRASLKEEASDVFAESGGLLGRCGGALADILSAVDGADTGFEDEFTAFRARPGTEGNLAAALQSGEQSALGDNGGAGLGGVARAKDLGGFASGTAASAR